MMTTVILSALSLISALSYLILMLKYRHDWLSTDTLIPEKNNYKTRITVIIASRNEERNIEECLRSISIQNYPKDLYEIILIDDHSEDKTVEKALNLKIGNLRILNLEEGTFSKKKALEIGIKNSDAELIVCTDADCTVGRNWLKSIASLYLKGGVRFIAGPVMFDYNNTIFEKFQALDFLGMIAITAAGIRGRYLNMCNGANLAYPRAVFNELGGFQGIDGIASGDDMLFMHKVAKKYPDGIRFLKTQEAIVRTSPTKSLSEFWYQRIRWASKNGSYSGYGTQIQLLLVWFFMLMLFISSISAIILSSPQLIVAVLSAWLLKSLADYLLLSSSASFFGHTKLLKIFLPALLLHWAYIFSVGLWANISKKYFWKGRKLS